MSISVATAEAVIEAAQQEFDDEPAIYEGDMPEDDGTKIEEAEELIEQAKLAAADGWDNSAVDAILSAADAEQPDDQGDDDDEPEDDDELAEPWDGYDDLKVSQTLKKLRELDDDELAEVFEYETANRNRGMIIKNLEAIAQERAEDASDADEDDDGSAEDADATDPGPEPEDDPEEEPEEEETSLPEPWRGYDKRQMSQIIKKLPKLDEEELAEVYDYELENKNRKGIMTALAKLAEANAPDPEPDDDPIDDDDPAEAEMQDREEPENDPDGEHLKLVKKVTDRVDEEFFSVPKKLPREITELPFDMTQESDESIRRLHSAFTSYFARAAYVAKLEGQLADACKFIADKKSAEIIASTSKIDPDTKKEKTATVLKAEAESDPVVSMWRDRHQTHSMISNNSKKDCEIYDRNISSLSREWTMRHEEYEHTGGLKSKPKIRNK